jgi:glutathione synthase/RimK-type ligase-like ATP-grasp enzyme
VNLAKSPSLLLRVPKREGSAVSKVHVIHENSIWVEPLRAAFAELATPFEEWFLDQGVLDLRSPPPDGVFYNRMSASSHTRDHRYAAEYTGAVLAWLERHGRAVVNDSRALRLEISKVAQYEALGAHRIPVPDTLAVVGRDNIVRAAEWLGFPLILKHNRGGKGLGVRLFLGQAALKEHLDSAEFEAPVDGITLVQRYIEAPEPFITRLEFVGGRFLYAVKVDTSQGFELCPADACQADAAAIGSAACPAIAPKEKFRIVEDYENSLIPTYERFLAANGIGIAGIEVIVDGEGLAFTYDVNTNTNYNPDAEARAGVFGMRSIARHLDGLLKRQHSAKAA